MNHRLNQFLDLSVALTGFDRPHLRGTGLVADHLDTLDRVVSPAVVDQLLQAYAALPNGAAMTDGGKDEASLSTRILDDPLLGPLARTLIVLWYTGSWTPLPADWPAPMGRSPLDVARVVSPAAYFNGLQWSAAHAHAPGALPTGFASWATPPMGVES